jgi:hypothetical protein
MARHTVGVCGFGRCGSTMAMAMLRAGGLPAVDGSDPVSGELPDLALAHRMAPDELVGRAVKLLDSIEYYRLPLGALEWRFVWLDRSHREQARSAVKFAETVLGQRLTGDSVDRFVASYEVDRPRVLSALRKAGPVLVLRYENVLANPRKAAKRMRDNLWPDLDIGAAAAAVHDRDGTCRPDLAFETQP